MTTVKNDYGNNDYGNIDSCQLWLPLIMALCISSCKLHSIELGSSRLNVVLDFQFPKNKGRSKWY